MDKEPWDNKLHDRFHWNVMSARYSVMPKEKWTCHGGWRLPSSTNKQAGENLLTGILSDEVSPEIIDEDYNLPHDTPLQDAATDIQETSYMVSEESYNQLLNIGVCREEARSVLPMGQYTECFVTANLGDWMLFLKRRLDSHAQKEIRVYAHAIYDILSELFPVAVKAFMDFQHHAVTLSGPEISALREILAEDIKIFELNPDDRVKLLERHGLTSKRERVEFFKKLK
nr:hypothetical protein 7 [bacterium]